MIRSGFASGYRSLGYIAGTPRLRAISQTSHRFQSLVSTHSLTSLFSTMSVPAPTGSPSLADHAPVRAALLGSGLFATNSYLPSLVNVPGFEISTVWSRSDKSVSALVAKAAELGGLPNVADLKAKHGVEGLNEVLADPEIKAVILVLPIGAQPGLIRTAWKAGKHVISEKPLGRDVAEATSLIDEYERDWKPKGLIWRVAESESCVMW